MFIEQLKFKNISFNYLFENISSFLKLEKSSNLEPTWENSNYLYNLDNKFISSLAILDNEFLIGFIICSKKENCLHIHRFIIANEYQGKGIGKLLLREFIKNSKIKFREVSLKVSTSNKAAIAFYLNNSFEILDDDNNFMYMIHNLGNDE